MIKGVVYRYIAPDGRCYVGQTIDENRRKHEFSSMAKCGYRSAKLKKAIEKYGVESFTYEVLFSKEYESKEAAQKELLDIEEHYIKHFDSYNNGFNMTLGGLSIKGFKMPKELVEKQRMWLKEYYKTHPNPFKGKQHTEENKRLLSEYAKKRTGDKCSFYGKHHSESARAMISKAAKQRTGEKNHFFGKKHKESTKKAISEANSVPVVQIDSKTNEVIREFRSAHEAGAFLGNPKLNSEIIKCCRGYISPSGKRYLTCKGYKWKYKE